MKLELKNVKINLEFSEETIQFKADLYVNGKKCAYSYNDGRGGCTFYREYSIELRPLLEQAEAYCKTLPSKFIKYGEKTIEIKSTLEHWIDELVCDISNKKEADKHKKKLAKDMSKGLCYGTFESYSVISWKGITIEKMLASANGRAVLRAKILQLESEGKFVLNTNILLG